MEERRIWKRRSTPRPGHIEPPAGPSQACTVSEHSRVGARLEIADAEKVPNRFVLVFEDNDQRVNCTVRWRQEGVIGVEFV